MLIMHSRALCYLSVIWQPKAHFFKNFFRSGVEVKEEKEKFVVVCYVQTGTGA